jgi:hypothetical protein
MKYRLSLIVAMSACMHSSLHSAAWKNPYEWMEAQRLAQEQDFMRWQAQQRMAACRTMQILIPLHPDYNPEKLHRKPPTLQTLEKLECAYPIDFQCALKKHLNDCPPDLLIPLEGPRRPESPTMYFHLPPGLMEDAPSTTPEPTKIQPAEESKSPRQQRPRESRRRPHLRPSDYHRIGEHSKRLGHSKFGK